MSTEEKYKKKLMLLTIACLLSVGLAFGQLAFGADVRMDQAGLSFSPGAMDNFLGMTVRIANSSNELVLDVESDGEAVAWSAAGMPDGTYRYECVVVFYNPNGDSRFLLERTSDIFEVQIGQIVVPKEDNSGDDQNVGEQSLLHELGTSAIRVAMRLMDLLVPSAYAADLKAESIHPQVFFDDTDDEFPTGSWDWRIWGEGGTNVNDTNNIFTIESYREIAPGNPIPIPANVTIMSLKHNGATGTNSSQNSIIVEQNGDIKLANTAVFIDRSTKSVQIGSGLYYNNARASLGIGNLNPFSAIDAVGTSIRLKESPLHGTKTLYLGFDELEDVTHIDTDGGALDISSSGNPARGGPLLLNWGSDGTGIDNVGIGGGNKNPSALLTVSSRFGGAVILVDDNGPFDKRQMFVLENNGAPSFRFRNSATGRAWTFAMTDNPPTDEFVINDPFSPGREMFLDRNGNAEFEGSVRATNFIVVSDRNLKGNIEPVDGGEVLRKVMELPISTWNLKDDSEKQLRIGPMGQDFKKIFGLGPDDQHISVTDVTGVALAAIQGLGEKNDQLAEIVRDKDTQIADLEKRLSVLEHTVSRLTQTAPMTSF